MPNKGSTLTPRVDLTGRKFGRLRVIARKHKTPLGHYFWECECDCGAIVVKRGASLQSGNTLSCGCLRKEKTGAKNRSHEQSGTLVYRVWRSMKYRCSNPRAKDYPDYGGRGIKVCERWLNSFENFLADLGPRPTPQHSIERLDNDGNYEPGNCVWATKQEQNRNRRKIGMLARFTDEELLTEVRVRGLEEKLLTKICA